MEDKKKNVQLLKDMKSDNAETVLNTVKKIRKEGNTAIMPELIYLLHTTNNDDIKISATNLLNDLKDNKAAPHIIEAINNEKYTDIAHILISSCWQSRLDYSDYLNVFVDLTIKSEYRIALEAFTVIEDMQKNISEDEKNKTINKLKKNIIIEKYQQKQMLLNELIKVIQNINLDKEYV